MSEVTAGPGTCWVRVKSTDDFRIIHNQHFDAALMEKYPGPQDPRPAYFAEKAKSKAQTPAAPAPAPKEPERKKIPVEKPEAVSQVSQEAMAGMSFDELKRLPEFALASSQSYRTKDELIKAILEVRGRGKKA